MPLGTNGEYAPNRVPQGDRYSHRNARCCPGETAKCSPLLVNKRIAAPLHNIASQGKWRTEAYALARRLAAAFAEREQKVDEQFQPQRIGVKRRLQQKKRKSKRPWRPCEPREARGAKLARAGGLVKAQPRAPRTSRRCQNALRRALGGDFQASRAGVRSGAAAPCASENGGCQETRRSCSKPGSGWAVRSQCGIGSGSSSQVGG
jgi:hypothetical protein